MLYFWLGEWQSLTLRQINFKTQLHCYGYVYRPHKFITRIELFLRKRSSNRRNLKTPAFRFRVSQEGTYGVTITH